MKTKALKRFLLTLVFTTLTIALSACSGDKAGESSSQITIGIPQDIEDSLDPHKAVAAGTEEVLFNLYEGLVKPDSSGELQPALASDFQISEDATTYTFTLREGVKFHDGSPVTAEDVKYSIDRCADTTNGDPLVAAYSHIQSVNILDEKTVEVVLDGPDTDFLAYMTNAVIPASNENPDTNPIGTGPYKYVSRSPQENFVVEKFDDYWGTPANIEHVTFKVCANGKYYMPELNDMYKQDLDKAKELLKEAGYENGFSFTITVPSNYQQHIDTAQVIVEQLKKIGVTAEINLIEWDSWLSDVYAGRKYEATVVGVDASSLTPSALLSRFVSTASNNFVNFSNADYDAAYAKALGTIDDEEKTAAFKECETLLAEHAANVYIQDLPCLVALNKKYAGYEFYPLYVQDISKLYIVED